MVKALFLDQTCFYKTYGRKKINIQDFYFTILCSFYSKYTNHASDRPNYGLLKNHSRRGQ